MFSFPHEKKPRTTDWQYPPIFVRARRIAKQERSDTWSKARVRRLFWGLPSDAAMSGPWVASGPALTRLKPTIGLVNLPGWAGSVGRRMSLADKKLAKDREFSFATRLRKLGILP